MDRIPNLKAGVGHPSFVESDDTMEFFARRLVSLVAVMTQQAGQIATVFAEHNTPEDGVTADSINHALMYQAKHFLQTLDDDNVLHDVLTMESCIFATEEADEDESLPQGHPENFDHQVDFDDDIQRCTCPLCSAILEAVETWDVWVPEDEIEQYLRKSVENAIQAAEKHAVGE